MTSSDLQTTAAVTPREAGFRPRAEWEAHARTWIAWPAHPETFVGSVAEAQQAFARVANTLAEFEPVAMVLSPDQEKTAQRLLASDIELLPWGINDAWMRDIAPSFLVNAAGEVAGTNWVFNDYGNKDGRNLEGYGEDAATAARILRHRGMRRFASDLVCEGGTLVCDGDGTLISNASVVLNPNRNPGMTREEADAIFGDYLNVDTVIWFEDGLTDDDTDGHTDNLVAFGGPGRVLLLSEDDPGDSNFATLNTARHVLEQASDAGGRGFDIIPVPQPRARYKGELRYALSYVNFCLANGAVLIPAFDDPSRDASARDIIAEQFPGRKAVSLPSLAIIAGGGSLHCITHEEPAACAE
ncbi:MAG: agmatine deiminase family protein [Gammaproteobacteria bacterium]